MASTPSTMLALGTPASDFTLADASGREYRLTDFAGAPGLVIMFICNHCPYVKHIRKRLAEVAREYTSRGMRFVAINSNDVESYPEDSPARMAEEAKQQGYVFPYLFDETQAVAKAYRAACTPEFYVFDRERQLVYHGQFDAARPGNGAPVTGEDLIAAMDAVLAERPVPPDQKPSLGCNIKWKGGNAPSYD
ncbi:MAG: thioredoxin family protein [Polyangiaceae bacterium]|nr:thioredoxin family protein [Polyangiaceae bacterium]